MLVRPTIPGKYNVGISLGWHIDLYSVPILCLMASSGNIWMCSLSLLLPSTIQPPCSAWLCPLMPSRPSIWTLGLALLKVDKSSPFYFMCIGLIWMWQNSAITLNMVCSSSLMGHSTYMSPLWSTLILPCKIAQGQTNCSHLHLQPTPIHIEHAQVAKGCFLGLWLRHHSSLQPQAFMFVEGDASKGGSIEKNLYKTCSPRSSLNGTTSLCCLWFCTQTAITSTSLSRATWCNLEQSERSSSWP